MTWQLVRTALALAGLVVLGLTLLGVIGFHGDRIGWGYARDFYAYWAADLDAPYSTPVGVGYAYLYSPVFIQILAPLKLLPFEVASAVWLLAGLLALWWLKAVWMLAIPGVSSDLLLGNVNVFIALAIVASFRWPGTWALPALTKVTPAIGLVCLMVDRRWRSLAWALVVTGALVAVSMAVAPSVWGSWVEVLVNSGESRMHTTAEFGPLYVRLPLAIGLAAAAGATRKYWLLPIAALVSMPVLWPATLAVLTAIPRLWSRQVESP